MKIRLTEAAAALLPASSDTTDGKLRYRARLIEGDRWGSSGYYDAEVIRRDGPTCWPAGTQMFADHPSESEKWDRPERSIKDLLGIVESTPVYEADNPQGAGLYADVAFHAHVAPFIKAIGESVGLSIRAGAEVTTGERQGRTGPIITRLAEGQSVDVVTKAGAGGALVQLLESDRRERDLDVAPALQRLQASEALPGGMTADDLKSALRDMLRTHFKDVEQAWPSLDDFTDEYVYFRLYSDGATTLWQHGYSATDTGTLELSGDAVQVRVQTSYVPVESPGQLPTTTRTATVTAAAESNPGGPTVPMTQIDESELRELREAKAAKLAAEADRDAARLQIAESDARAAARPIVAAVLAESTILPAVSQLSLAESLVLAVPLNGDRKLDETVLRQRAVEARTQRETELTAALEAAGVGTPRGGGANTEQAGGSGGSVGGHSWAPAGSGERTQADEAQRKQITESRRAAFGYSPARGA